MGMADDFSPIVESGTLEQPRGMRRWLLGHEAPPSGNDRHAIVLVLGDGKRVQAGGRTAGERALADARRWVKVDVGAHSLSYEVALRDRSGRVGLVATVTVRCRVADPAAAAGEEDVSVRELVRAPLEHAVVAAYGGPDAAQDDDPMVVLNATREDAHRRLTGLIERAIPGLDWLTAVVTAVTVAFDATTRAHYDELLRLAREKDLIASQTSTRVAQVEGEKAVGDAQREAFDGRLGSEQEILLEALIRDPSAERLEYFAMRLRDLRRGDLDAAMQAYRYAVDNGIDPSPFEQHLRRLLPGAAGAQGPTAPDAIEGSTVAGEIESESGGDHDWSRRPQ
jgi:hypothetical protein